jgi:putative ABC transport system substrate-binding protein
MSYGPDIVHQYRQAASSSTGFSEAKSRPNCRCRAPTKYELVVNLKTAKALGLEVPRRCSPAPTLLARADEVIE